MGFYHLYSNFVIVPIPALFDYLLFILDYHLILIFVNMNMNNKKKLMKINIIYLLFNFIY